jgi:hypothetical protein
MRRRSGEGPRWDTRGMGDKLSGLRKRTGWRSWRERTTVRVAGVPFRTRGCDRAPSLTDNPSRKRRSFTVYDANGVLTVAKAFRLERPAFCRRAFMAISF